MGNYFQYWGKARADVEGGPAYHLLPYHCLDVAAVARVWWQKSQVIRDRFTVMTGQSEAKASAWVLFFIALHDLGKFDVRFQLKASDIACELWPEFRNADESQSVGYWHGNYSSFWLFHDLASRFGWDDDFSDEELWDAWKPWIFAVAGHHGVIPTFNDGIRSRFADNRVIEHDKESRLQFMTAMESLFLHPAGLSFGDELPTCDQDFLAGFCSVCDWLGSTEVNKAGKRRFAYKHEPMPLEKYFLSRLPIAEQVLNESGLFESVKSMGGMVALFPDKPARLVQTLMDKIPQRPGLTIIEAPTGSGKTEAALAYASRLLAGGVAESIIFALPTQATSNAMFERLEVVTGKIFGSANMLLAHGKAGFNERFINLKAAFRIKSPQDRNNETEAQVQCSQWLGQSRKRVFLGQVGVCTIDQVLISVLPVKHKFVRSFGLGKSILIVDEVHAYDSYMYGLLQEVLCRQQQMLGSAILLSATLPGYQKEALVTAWGGSLDCHNPDAPYPLISHFSGSVPSFFELPERERKNLQASGKTVYVDVIEHGDMQFDDEMLGRVIQAANAGANVAVVCNLVADAQFTARRLRDLGAETVYLFHSRFRFVDRQGKEQAVLSGYGKGEGRKKGGILVATQVVEQSLDLDFDWMLTQLCPMDSLFQRLGRLHRHQRERPTGLEQAKCTVVVPETQEYGLHAFIYGGREAPNTCILWRTEQRLREKQILRFPEAYRPEIEWVYQEDAWENEPEDIRDARARYVQAQQGAHLVARQLVNSDTHFSDSDSKASLLTRDGEMSLNVIPVLELEGSRLLLDGRDIAGIDEYLLAEELSRNTVPVPASWRRYLPQERDGLIWLSMKQRQDETWEYLHDGTSLIYSLENGLERKEV